MTRDATLASHLAGIQARTIAGILRGWAIGPAAGFLATYLAVWLLGGR
ncbi:hypothetical protein [Acidiphilium sp.]|nr:hypothetical protein [Acidiphilium sp.]